MSYEEYIIQTHLDIRNAIKAYALLPDLTPAQVKQDIWKALVEALNLVQNEMALQKELSSEQKDITETLNK